jgi:hypothetical protein
MGTSARLRVDDRGGGHGFALCARDLAGFAQLPSTLLPAGMRMTQFRSDGGEMWMLAWGLNWKSL